MKVDDKLVDLYSGYYEGNSAVAQKRAITAVQTVQHIQALLSHPPYDSLLDVGAGEGSVLAALSQAKFANGLHAVEISGSGVEAIKAKRIPRLCSVRQFDGYKIDAPDQSYTVGMAIHVLEHVEHERAFLQEIARVCKLMYVEVPLENTAFVRRAMKISGPYGHLNYYNTATFRNLLQTSGLEVLDLRVFANSLAYEQHVGRPFVGAMKWALRSSLLRVAGRGATSAMVYLAGAVCHRRT